MSALPMIYLSVARAADAPTAGQATQELAPRIAPPRNAPAIDLQAPATPATAPGGAQAPVQSIVFTGNRHFSDAQLLAVLGDATGRAYDLAGLRGLADRAQAHYREGGFPFARVLVPAQEVSSGQVQLQVIEGRYGQVGTRGDAWMAPRAKAFLSALVPGDHPQ